LDTNVLTDHELRGRVALVTGAGRGIGRGAAVGLARRSARVVAVDINQGELETTSQLLKDAHAEAMIVNADLRSRSEIDGVLERAAQRWGKPDILVNNAAVMRLKPFEQMNPTVWDEAMKVNLDAAYYLTWRLYADMIAQRRGHIVTVSSTSGVRPYALETAYCCSKYALEGLFRSLAIEAAPYGVIVTLSTPGKKTKWTSVSDAEFAKLPEPERREFASPLAFAEAFGFLAAADDRALSGRRFDLHALAELVRKHGWSLPPWMALQGAELTNDAPGAVAREVDWARAILERVSIEGQHPA
jgi:NAD(P)-dependent dehydrogenase (short-subunit alcohol dehydrogenase family)